MRRVRKKVNYFKLFGTIIAFILLCMVIFIVINRPDKSSDKKAKKEDNKVTMKELVGKAYSDYQKELEEYGLDIETEYSYDDEVEKDKVISQSIVNRIS